MQVHKEEMEDLLNHHEMTVGCYEFPCHTTVFRVRVFFKWVVLAYAGASQWDFPVDVLNFFSTENIVGILLIFPYWTCFCWNQNEFPADIQCGCFIQGRWIRFCHSFWELVEISIVVPLTGWAVSPCFLLCLNKRCSRVMQDNWAAVVCSVSSTHTGNLNHNSHISLGM